MEKNKKGFSGALKQRKKMQVLVMSLVCLLATLAITLICIFSISSKVVINDSTDLVQDDIINNPDKKLPIENMDFRVESAEEATFIGVKGDDQIFNDRTVLEIPKETPEGIPVTKIDIEYNHEKIKIASTGLPVLDSAFKETSQYKSRQFTHLIIPATIKEIAQDSFWGFASLEYMNVPFIGTTRINSNNVEEISNYQGTIGSLFGGEDSALGSHLRMARFANFDFGSGTPSKIASSQDYLNDGDQQASRIESFIPCGLRKIIVTGKKYVGKPNDQSDDLKMENIAKAAFYHNTTLEEIVIGADDQDNKIKILGSVGSNAFSYCEKLKTLTFNVSNAADLQSYLCNGCPELTNVKLPDKLEAIPKACFANDTKLQNINLSQADVKTIGQGAFFKCVKLPADFATKLPTTLVEISEGAFKGCTSLTEVNLDNTINLNRIGKGAFYGCYGVTTMRLPFIGENNSSLPYGGSSIQPSQEKEFILKRQGNVFNWIFAQASLDFDNGYHISDTDSKFYFSHQFCCKLNGDQYIDAYIPAGLTHIYISGEAEEVPVGAFQGLANVKLIAIKNTNLKFVGSQAFAGCNSLEELIIPRIDMIRYNGDGYTGYHNDVYHNGSDQSGARARTHIGRLFGLAAAGDDPLLYKTGAYDDRTYTLPKSLKIVRITNQEEIFTANFQNTEIRELEISKNTKCIRYGILAGCEYIEKITLPFVGEFRAKEYSRNNFYDWDDGVERILSDKFTWIFGSKPLDNSGASYLDDSYSPHYSYNRRYVPNALREIRITDESYISSYAFRGLKNVTNLTIDSVVGLEIENACMYGMSNLVKLSIPFLGNYRDSNGTIHGLFGNGSYENSYLADYPDAKCYIPKGLAYIEISDSSAHLNNSAFYGLRNLETVSLNFPIAAVAPYAFANCSSLYKFEFLNNYNPEVIGDHAFDGCLALTELDSKDPTIHQNIITDKTKTIGDYAFARTSISEVSLEHFNKIGNYAFSGCNEIKNVVIPDYPFVELGNGLFADCSYLLTATLAKNTARKDMFRNCVMLNTLDLSDQAGTIPAGICDGCSNLRNLTINLKVTEIGARAFAGCKSLNDFTIPSEVTIIDDGAFAGCTGFKDMIIPNNVTEIGVGVFDKCSLSPLFTLYVYKPEAEWPVAWSENWNCNFPVYVIGYQEEEIYEYKEFNEGDLVGWEITGVVDGYQLGTSVSLPKKHNGMPVYALGENALADQLDVREIFLPEHLKVIRNGALMNMADSLTIYAYANKEDLADGTFNVNPDGQNKDANFMTKGLIYYGNQWRKSGTHAILNVDTLDWANAWNNKERLVYDGKAKTRKIQVLRTNATIVGGAQQIELDYRSFNFEYSNNIKAGNNTASVVITTRDDRFYGDHKENFSIEKAKLTVKVGREEEHKDPLSSNDHPVMVNYYANHKNFDGKPWTYSSFGTQNIEGLPETATVRGTLQTVDFNVPTKLPFYFDNLIEWKNGYYSIYDAALGQDVTNNYELSLEKVIVFIHRTKVEARWGNSEIPYDGLPIKPTAKFFTIDNNPYIANGLDITEAASIGLKYNYAEPIPTEPVPGFDNGSVTIADYNTNNISIVNLDLEGTFKYTVVKADLNITVQNDAYLIDPKEEYWSCDFSQPLPGYVTVTGLGHASIEGVLKTESDKDATFNFGSTVNKIEWQNGNMKILMDGKDVTSFYNINVEAVVTIIYNDMNLKYFIVTNDQDGHEIEREEIDFERDENGILKVNENGYFYMLYEADGKPKQFIVESDAENKTTVGYQYGIGTNVTENPDTWVELTSKDKDIRYVVVATASAKRYNTVKIPKDLTGKPDVQVLAFEVVFVPSTVKVAEEWKAEYTGEGFDPTPFILKKADDQDITFEYYSYENASLSIPLSEPPVKVGKYWIKLNIPVSKLGFFRNITNRHDNNRNVDAFEIEIIPKKVSIELDPSDPRLTKIYDGYSWSLAITPDLFNSPSTPLIPGDVVTGKIVSNSPNIGIYEQATSGLWFIDLLVRSNSGENVTGCYEFIINFKAEITPIDIEYKILGSKDLSSLGVPTGNYYQYNVGIFNGSDQYVLVDKGSLRPALAEVTYKYAGPYSWYDEGELITYPFDAMKKKDSDEYDIAKVGEGGFTEEFVKISEPGEYVVWIKITAANCNTVLVPAVITNVASDEIADKVSVNDVDVNFDSANPQKKHCIDVKVPDGQGYRVYYSKNIPEYEYVFDSEVSNYGAHDITKWETDKLLVSENIVGEYIIYVKIIKDGFKPFVTSAKLTIRPEGYNQEIKGLSIKGYESTYDGKPHTVEILGIQTYYDKVGKNNVHIYSTDNILALGVEDSVYWHEGLTEYINYGEYTVYVMIKIDNYQTYFSSLEKVLPNVIIKQVDPTVTFPKNLEVEYCKAPIPDSAITDKIIVDPAHDGFTKLTFYNVDSSQTPDLSKPLPENPTELGDYYVKVDYFGTMNCVGKHVEGPFKIVPRVITFDDVYKTEFDYRWHFPNVIPDTHTTDEFKYGIVAQSGPLTKIVENGKEMMVPLSIGTYKIEIQLLTQTKYYVLQNNGIVDFEITPRTINLDAHVMIPWMGAEKVKVDFAKISEFMTPEQIDSIDTKLLDSIFGRNPLGQEIEYKNVNHHIEGYVETNSGDQAIYSFITGSELNSLDNFLKIVDNDGNEVTYNGENVYKFNVDNLFVEIADPVLEIPVEESYTVPYDGLEHGMRATIPAGINKVKFSYSAVDGDINSYSPIEPKFTDAGTYTVHYYATAAGFQPQKGSYTIEITPIDLDIQSTDINVTYSDTVVAPEYELANIKGSIDEVKDLAEIYYFKREDVTRSQLEDLFNNFSRSNPNYSIFENYRYQDVEFSTGKRLDRIRNTGNYYRVVYYKQADINPAEWPCEQKPNWNMAYSISEDTIKGIEIDLTFDPSQVPGGNRDSFGNVVYKFDYNGKAPEIMIFGIAQISTTNLLPTHQMSQDRRELEMNTIKPNTPDANLPGDYYEGNEFLFARFCVYNEEGENVGTNYIPNTHHLRVRVNPVVLPSGLVKFDPEQIFSYTGEPILPKIDKPRGSGDIFVDQVDRLDPMDKNIVIEPNIGAANVVNVGYYKFVIGLEDGQNYLTNNEYYTIYVRINKSVIEITWHNTVKEYDGLVLAPSFTAKNEHGDYPRDNSGMPIKLTARYANPDEGILAGQYLAVLVVDDPSIYDNFEFVNSTWVYIIKKKKYSITIRDTMEYSGHPWNLKLDDAKFSELIAKNGEKLLPNHTLDGYIETNSADPNTYMYGVSVYDSISSTFGESLSDFTWVPNIKVNTHNLAGEAVVKDASGSFDVDFDMLVKIVGGKVRYKAEKHQIYGYDGNYHGFNLQITFPQFAEAEYTFNWYKDGDKEHTHTVQSLDELRFIERGKYIISFTIKVPSLPGQNVATGEDYIVEIVKGKPVFSISQNLSHEFNGKLLDEQEVGFQINTDKDLPKLINVVDSNYRFNGTKNDLLWHAYMLGPVPTGNGILLGGTDDHGDVKYENLPVGYYKITVSSKADAITPEDNNYKDLVYEKIFEITPKKINVKINETIVISSKVSDPTNPNKNQRIYVEGTEQTITGEQNISIYKFKYELLIEELKRGIFEFNLESANNETILAPGFRFNWNFYESNLGKDEINNSISSNYIITLAVKLNIKYRDIDMKDVPNLLTVWEPGGVPGTSKMQSQDIKSFINNPSQKAEAEITYSYNGINYQKEEIKFGEPTTGFTVYFMVYVPDFEKIVDSYIIIIDKKEREGLTTDALDNKISKVYDDEVLNSLYYPQVIGPQVDQVDLFTQEDLEWVFKKLYTEDQNSPDYLLGEEIKSPVDVGTYVLVAKVPETKHYKKAEVGCEFKITKRELLLSISTTKMYDQNVWRYSVDKKVDEKLIINGLIVNHKLAIEFETISADVNVYNNLGINPNWIENVKVLKPSIDGEKLVTGNYSISFTDETAIEIVPANIVYDAIPYYGEFDNQNHAPTINIVFPKLAKVYYSEAPDGFANPSTKPITKSEVGEYTIYYKIDAGANYNIVGPESVKITIVRAKTRITNEIKLSKTYDGDSVFCPSVELNYKAPQETIDNIEFHFYDEHHGKICGGKLFEVMRDSKRPKDVGKYFIVIKVPASETHDGMISDYIPFTISKYTTKIQWTGTNFDYNGLVQKPTAKFATPDKEESELTLKYTIEQLELGDKTSTKPGRYRIVVDPDSLSNYIIENAKCEYIINRCMITIMLNQEFVYTGKDYYSFFFDANNEGGSDKYQVIGLPENLTISGELRTLSGNAEDFIVKTDEVVAGNTEFHESFKWEGRTNNKPLIVNNIGEDVVDDCIQIKYDLSVRVTHDQIDVTINNVKEQYYDGKPHSILVTTTAKNVEILYSLNPDAPKEQWTKEAPKFTHVNKETASDGKPERYKTYFRIYSTQGDGNKLLKAGDGYVEILKADPKFDFARPIADMVYNGAAPKLPEYSYLEMNDIKQQRDFSIKAWPIDEKGNHDEDTSPITEWSKLANVGNYYVKFTLPGSSEYYSDYEDAIYTAQFKITKREIIISVPDYTKKYDKIPWQHDVRMEEVKNLAPGHYFRGVLATKDYRVHEYVEQSDFFFNEDKWQVLSSSGDVTNNYEVVIDTRIEIVAAEFDCDFNDTIVKYDGNEHEIYYVIRGLTKQEYTLEFGLSLGTYGSDRIFRRTGTTTVYYRLQADNYVTKEGFNVIQILPLKGNLYAEFIDKTYDGDPIADPKITTPSTGKVLITYYNEDLDPQHEKPIKEAPINAGSYKAEITVLADEKYEEMHGVAAFNIGKRTVKVEWDKKVSFPYDGLEHAPIAKATGVKGESVAIKVLDWSVNAGQYTARATTEDENYILDDSTVSCAYEITKKEISIPEFPTPQQIETGDDIIIKDKDGNKYVVDEDGNVVEIIHPDGTSEKDPNLDFVIIIVPNPDNPDKGGKFEIHPKDPNTTLPGNKDKQDIDYEIIPKPIANPQDNVRVDYRLNNTYTGSDIYPIKLVEYNGKMVKAVYYTEAKKAEDAKMVKPKEIILIEGVDYKVEYIGDIKKPDTEKDQKDKAKFRVYANETLPNRRYTFDVTYEYNINLEEVNILTLYPNAKLAFVSLDEDEEKDIRKFVDTERKEANQKNNYIGHMYQRIEANYYVKMFDRSENIKIFKPELDTEGNIIYKGKEVSYIELAKNPDGTYMDEQYVGTNWKFVLYDQHDKQVDEAYTILFGDCNGDGDIDALDQTRIIEYQGDHYDILKGLFLVAVGFTGNYRPSAIDLTAVTAFQNGEFEEGEELNNQYNPFSKPPKVEENQPNEEVNIILL